MNLEFNNRIRKYREQKKMTQKELGEAIGMKNTAYSRMERMGSISVEDVFNIAEVLDIDPDLILYGEVRANDIIFAPPEVSVLPLQTPVEDPFGRKQAPDIFVEHLSDDERLTTEEWCIVRSFRSFSDEDKQEVRDLIDNIRTQKGR